MLVVEQLRHRPGGRSLVQMTSTERNWAGNVTFGAAEVVHPVSLAELQELMASRSKLRVLGSGHSFNPIAGTTGTLVCLDRLGAGVELDPGARRAWVPAGATYAMICPELDAAGWALRNLASVPHVTVAGACATGTHGSGRSNPGLAAAVDAIELVRVGGELETLSSSATDFSGSVVALGALGVVTRMRLELEPSYDVAQEVWLDVPLGGVLERLDQVLGAGHSVSLFTTWAEPTTLDQVWVKRRVSPGDPAATGTGEPLDDLLGGHRAPSPAHPVPGADPAHATAQLGLRGPWYERLPHFRADAVPSAGDELQSEWLVSAGMGAAALDRLAALAATLAPAVLACEVRAVAADEQWLSPTWRRDAVALHFTWRPDEDRVSQLLHVVEDALAPFDPRPHWGKLSAMEPAALARAYPRLADFRELAERVDPERVLSNPFVDYCLGR